MRRDARDERNREDDQEAARRIEQWYDDHPAVDSMPELVAQELLRDLYEHCVPQLARDLELRESPILIRRRGDMTRPAVRRKARTR